MLPTKARRFAVPALIGLVVAAQAAAAGAVHWPFFGGDNGRSGNQPVDEGVPPAAFLYSKADAPSAAIVTSIITSAGMPANQRVIYGTADGRVHLRTLESGAEVGPAGGHPVSTEPNAFGDGIFGSVSFGETSSPAGLGQVFAAHNGPLGVEIAQIDEATGGLVRDDPVVGAEGFSINSSVMLTGPAADTGNRALFFVAENDTTGVSALFRVPITAAATTGATIGASTNTGDIRATPEASPTLVFLAAGAPYIAVGTLDGKVLTFKASDLAAGPSATLGVAGEEVQTPSVPVTTSGMTPGGMNSGTDRAPFIYVARRTDSNTNTVVHKLGITDATTPFTSAASPTLPGAAAPALATDQEIANGVADEGSVFVTTESNIYAVSTSGLAVTAKLSATDLEGGTSGFSTTTPVASGDVVFVARDSGEQLALSSATLQPLPASEFSQPDANTGSTSSVGQPSISRRFVQFASDKGLFVYRLAAPATPPGPGPGPSPRPGGGPGGTGGDRPFEGFGYRMVAADGGVFVFGDRGFDGSLGDRRLNKPIVGGATNPSTFNGYWMVAADGGVFTFGDAGFFGSLAGQTLPNPIVEIEPTPSGKGYFLVDAKGRVYPFGDAETGIPDARDLTLNQSIIGMTVTPTGRGYYLVASDGGIFTYGDANFLGSMGDRRLNAPVIDLAATPDGGGYYLLGGDGGVFSFGTADFKGSTGDIKLNKPAVAMLVAPNGGGYWFMAADGGVFTFGPIPFLGSTGDIKLSSPVLDAIN